MIFRILGSAVLCVCAFAVAHSRHLDHYAPPSCGGVEPRTNHEAALRILKTGRSNLEHYPPGYAYVTALVYTVAPNTPQSVQAVQIAFLPLIAVLLFGVLRRYLKAHWLHYSVFLYLPFAYYAAVYSGIYWGLVFGVVLLWLDGARLKPRVFVPCVALSAFALVAVRPDYAFIPVLFGIRRLLVGRGVERYRYILPGFLSAILFAVFWFINPPAAGTSFHGQGYRERGHILGAHQFKNRWVDFDWLYTSENSAMVEARQVIAEAKKRSGQDIHHPETQRILNQAYRQFHAEHPNYKWRKLVSTALRLYTFVPTSSSSLWLKRVIFAVDLFILLLALAGLAVRVLPRSQRVVLGMWLLLPVLLHWFSHVESRWSLPARPVEIILVFALMESIRRRFDEPTEHPRGLDTQV